MAVGGAGMVGDRDLSFPIIPIKRPLTCRLSRSGSPRTPTCLAHASSKEPYIVKKMFVAGHKGGEDLSAENAFSTELTAALDANAQLAKGLVIMSHSWKEDANHQYQFGPRLSGGDLRHWIMRGEVAIGYPGGGAAPCKQVLHNTRIVIEGITTGIMYLGDNKWTHRDVHPSNILLVVDGGGDILSKYSRSCLLTVTLLHNHLLHTHARAHRHATLHLITSHLISSRFYLSNVCAAPDAALADFGKVQKTSDVSVAGDTSFKCKCGKKNENEYYHFKNDCDEATIAFKYTPKEGATCDDPRWVWKGVPGDVVECEVFRSEVTPPEELSHVMCGGDHTAAYDLYSVGRVVSFAVIIFCL